MAGFAGSSHSLPCMDSISYYPCKCQVEKWVKTIGKREGSRSAGTFTLRSRAALHHGVFLVPLPTDLDLRVDEAGIGLYIRPEGEISRL